MYRRVTDQSHLYFVPRARIVARDGDGGTVRANYSSNGRIQISPTALGFLIPLFFLFIFGSLTLVYYVRRRGRQQRVLLARAVLAATPPPAIRREDAKTKLQTVTKVVDAVGAEKARCEGVIQSENEKAVDSASILDRECTICLSTLHAPSPPKPVKLATADDAITDEAAKASSMSPSEQEEILRLDVCSHEFHAECLVSWFVIRKYSCPICRAVYYEDPEKKEAKAIPAVE